MVELSHLIIDQQGNQYKYALRKVHGESKKLQ